MSLRVLFVGDLAPTGFGSVTTDLGRALLAYGLDVRFISQNDLGRDLPEPFRSRTADIAFYDYDQSGVGGGVSGVRSLLGDVIAGTSRHRLASGEPFGDWKPDVALVLGDFVAARLLFSRFSEPLSSLPVFHYVPVEGIDLPPLWAELWRVMRPVAMSRFGAEQIERVTGVEPAVAYHGVDVSTFYPVSPTRPLVVPLNPGAPDTVRLTSREACKRFFGLDPATRVVLRCDRNMPRKRYGSMLRALAPVLELEDVQLVIHARSFDQGGYLPDSLSKLSPAARSRVIVTDRPGLPREVLAALYNAADVYVSTSAEGFGLTIAEAIACGVPAVALDYSAVPEVLGPAGILVPVAQTYDNEYDHLWAWPDESAFGDAVRYLLDHPAKRRSLGALGPRHVETTFRWDVAAQIFAELFHDAVNEPGPGDVRLEGSPYTLPIGAA